MPIGKDEQFLFLVLSFSALSVWAVHRSGTPFGWPSRESGENARRTNSRGPGAALTAGRLRPERASRALPWAGGVLLESNARPFMATGPIPPSRSWLGLCWAGCRRSRAAGRSAIYIAMREIIQRFTRTGCSGSDRPPGDHHGVSRRRMGNCRPFSGRPAAPGKDSAGLGDSLLNNAEAVERFGKVCTARTSTLFEQGRPTLHHRAERAGKSTLINLLTEHLPGGRPGRSASRAGHHPPPHPKRVRLGICRSFQVVNVFPRSSLVLRTC